VIWILLASMLVGSASGKEQDTVDLTAYQWKNRLLILFAPSEEDLRYQSFKEQLQRRTQEVQDRDLLAFHVFETGYGRLAQLPLNKGQVLFLRRQFSIKPGQRIAILIGKDGEVKLRRELPVDLSEIFSVIDAMPMRQREMRERAK
jgi:Domain of unknown function (DUF4174)